MTPNTWATNVKTDKLYYEIEKKLCIKTQQSKKTTCKMREIFESPMCDKGLIFRIYKEL